MKVKLGDVCDKGSSNHKQSDVINQNGQYPVYGAAGLLGNIDSYHQDKPYVAVVKDGAGIGRVTLQPGYSSVIGTLQYLLPKENVLPEYLYYVTKHMHLEKYYTGATIPHIYFKDYKNEKFNLDAIEKQQRIVDILKKIENIIESRQQELQKLDDLIRARFVEMFGDPVYSAIDSKIELSDICEKITDGEHGSVARVANGHPFLNAKHILKTGFIDWKTITYIGDEDHQRIYKRCNPEKGDILLTTTGTIGNVAIMPECEEVSMDRGITLLKINRHKVTSEFVAEMLKHPSIQMAMGANVHASAIGHLFMNKVKKLPAILPSMKKQIEFTTFVQQIDKSKLLSGCRLFHSWAPEIEKSESCWRAPTEDKGFAGRSTPTMTPADRKNLNRVGVPRRRTKDLRGGRRQQ